LMKIYAQNRCQKTRKKTAGICDISRFSDEGFWQRGKQKIQQLIGGAIIYIGKGIKSILNK
ncbi:MAG: hypothetical protein SOT68_07775, partial [Oscillospiraceae bacterium]|nr:hypothetical protein [Oscillospiraceae bacterium]